jgi:hypothetical protein
MYLFMVYSTKLSVTHTVHYRLIIWQWSMSLKGKRRLWSTFNLPPLNFPWSKSKAISNRPWRPIGLWDIKAPTFSRQSAHRWRWGCQPHSSATLYPQEESWYWGSTIIKYRLTIYLTLFKNGIQIVKVPICVFIGVNVINHAGYYMYLLP